MENYYKGTRTNVQRFHLLFVKFTGNCLTIGILICLWTTDVYADYFTCFLNELLTCSLQIQFI